MNTPVRVFLSLMTALLLCNGQPVGAADEKPFSPERLDQLIAPIALHPDTLVAQVSKETLESISTPDKVETPIGTLEFLDGASLPETTVK